MTNSPHISTADREIVITRTINAPREIVFGAFTEARHLSRWWGPDGFTTTTRAFAFREGGVWDFVMHAPDGSGYPEWITWQPQNKSTSNRHRQSPTSPTHSPGHSQDGGFDWTAPDEEVFRVATDEVRGVGVYLLGRRL
jgi:hypothetical protein